MSITCFIRHEIDPSKHAGFEQYARNRGQCIPACGAELIGYFAPHEGSSTTANGFYQVGSLTDCEAHRARSKAHPLGKANYDVARADKFLRREDRLFLRLASAPHAPRAMA